MRSRVPSLADKSDPFIRSDSLHMIGLTTPQMRATIHTLHIVMNLLRTTGTNFDRSPKPKATRPFLLIAFQAPKEKNRSKLRSVTRLQHQHRKRYMKISFLKGIFSKIRRTDKEHEFRRQKGQSSFGCSRISALRI